jgi:hypothetical protein
MAISGSVMVTDETFDGIHEIVLPAELDKPDDQAKKDVSIVDMKNLVMESSRTIYAPMSCQPMPPATRYVMPQSATISPGQMPIGLYHRRRAKRLGAFQAAVSGSSPLQQVPGVMCHRTHAVGLRPYPAFTRTERNGGSPQGHGDPDPA